MNHPGVLITFEGLDGSGKTTQLELAAGRLRSENRAVIATKEPGGTAVGREIRTIVLKAACGPISSSTELALMFAARSQHVEEVILPALQSGALILCDRFTDSTFAYQGYGRGIPLDVIETLSKLLCRGVTPDLTLVLDIDPEDAVGRAIARNHFAASNENRFEDEGIAFFQRVRRGYEEIARREPQRVRIVDARGAEQEVYERISPIIDEFVISKNLR